MAPLVAFYFQLSFSRYAVAVWSATRDELAWLHVHNGALRRIGGVPATVRVDNEKTAVSQGAGVFGVINPGRRQPERPRPVTLYYCCGGYVTKGNSVCHRALVGKAALEGVVVGAARKHLDGIVATRGAAVVEALVQQEPSGGTSTISVGRDQARAVAASIVTWAQRASAMLATTTDPGSTQRLLRAIVKEILLNPENATCRIAFRAIPDLENDPTIAA